MKLTMFLSYICIYIYIHTYVFEAIPLGYVIGYEYMKYRCGKPAVRAPFTVQFGKGTTPLQ